MSLSTPTDDELHAYIDGRLAPPRAAELAQWLLAHPEAAARVAAFKHDAEMLRSALAGAAEALPANPLLDPRAIRTGLRRRRRAMLGMAASCVLALGIGGIGGWQLREARLQAQHLPMADAVAAYRLFADAAAPGALDGVRKVALQDWLKQHFGAEGAVPDLQAQGYRLHDGRLLSTPEGAAAMLVYEDAAGGRIGLYLRPRPQDFPTGERRDGRLLAQYWGEGTTAFALVGPATLTSMRQIVPLLRAPG